MEKEPLGWEMVKEASGFWFVKKMNQRKKADKFSCRLSSLIVKCSQVDHQVAKSC